MSIIINPFIFESAGGGGGVAFVSARGDGLGTSGGTSGSLNTSGSNFIVIHASWYPIGVDNPTLSDSQGNTWTPLTSHTTPGSPGILRSRLWYCYSPITNAAHTFTLSGAGGFYASIQIAAFSGVSASPFDLENGNNSDSGSTTLSTGSITPSQANSLVITGFSFALDGGTISIDSGYTIVATIPFNNGNYDGGSLAYKILTSSSAQNPTWTATSSPTYKAASIASFKY